jgi:hypothetical protein
MNGFIGTDVVPRTIRTSECAGISGLSGDQSLLSLMRISMSTSTMSSTAIRTVSRITRSCALARASKRSRSASECWGGELGFVVGAPGLPAPPRKRSADGVTVQVELRDIELSTPFRRSVWSRRRSLPHLLSPPRGLGLPAREHRHDLLHAEAFAGIPTSYRALKLAEPSDALDQIEGGRTRGNQRFIRGSYSVPAQNSGQAPCTSIPGATLRV